MNEANAIVKELTQECEPEVLVENLTEMYQSWVCYQDCPGREHREDITFTYNTLRHHLAKIAACSDSFTRSEAINYHKK